MEHFGVKLLNRGKSFKLIREEFAIINTTPSLPYFESLAKIKAYADEDGTTYAEDWCNTYRDLCLKNYDLNMEYFSKLDKIEFEHALTNFLLEYKNFTEVSDLNTLSGVEGFYIMALDEYKQVYIGKTGDIKKRILRHWSITKSFDRTLCPMYAWNKSCFSIDFFRALDTTRIFVWKRKISDGIEAKLIRSFPNKFCTNRIGGDITDAILALATLNQRQLV